MPTNRTIKKDALTPTALIAGGAGFIGSNLAETLLLKECRVVVLDSFKTGQKNYIENLLQNPKFALFDADINNGIPEEIESVDYVIHLAGLEEYLYNSDNANLDVLLTNSLGTRHLLELAQKSEAAFLLASSVDIYQGLISPVNIDNYFGSSVKDEKKYSLIEAKRFAEALVWEYFNKNNTNVRITRLPEIYGPRMNLESGGNLGKYINDLINGNGLVVYGDGVENEYYLYITDAVAGIIKALFNKNTKGNIYTLVDNEPHTTLEIVYMLKSLADKEVKIGFKNAPNDTPLIQPKIPESNNLGDLNWEPKTPLKEGTIKTLKYLGYETNQHNFKPTKILDEKRKEQRAEALGQVSSIAGEALNTPHIANTAPSYIHKVKSSNGLKFPSIPKLPHFGIPHPGSHLLSKKAFLLATVVLLSFILVFVAIPVVQTWQYTKSGLLNVQKVPDYIFKLDATKSQEESNKAFINFTNAQNALNKLHWLMYVIGKNNLYESSIRLLGSLKQFSKASYSASKAAVPFASTWDVIRPNTQTTFSDEAFNKSKLNLTSAKNSLQLAQAELKNVNPDNFPKKYADQILQYKKLTDRSNDAMELATSLNAAMPDLLGIDQPKKYLIVFQNPNEIRATGGFIGSYGLLELDKGKITNLYIDDIYNPDGQIDLRNISKTPPKPIKDFLKETKLHIRNANWDPDFTKSAKTIEELYTDVTGEKLSGVIGIDLYMAQYLLKVTGPIFLTAYNEEITSDNVYEKSQFHSEFNYVEGSTQKRQFLSVLGGKLLEKVFATPKDKMPNLLTELYTSFKERHFLIYLENNVFAATLEKEGWDGGLVQTSGDYLNVVNSNLGGTKANYYVKNTMDYKVSAKTRDGLLRGELTLTYKHTGQSDAWPGGSYTDYVRVLTHAGSKLTGTKLTYTKADGTSQTTDILEKMLIAKIDDYNSFETSFKLEPKDTVILKVEYDVPTNLSLTADNKYYSLYWQKQPGTQDDGISFSFSPPLGLKIAQTNINGTYTGDVLEYHGLLNTDQQMYLKLD